MVLNSDWMPRTTAGKVAMATNIKGKIGGYGTELDLDAAAIAEIEAFCNAIVTAYNHKLAVEAGKEATDTWFGNVLTGAPVGDPSPNATVLPVQGAIAGLVLGWVKKMREYRGEWVVASGYTTEIGEDLMIVASGDSPDTVEPTLNAVPAQTNYGLIITVTNRGDADFCIPQIRRKGGDWESLPGFVGRTFEYTISPTNDGDPETLDVRVQLYRKNEVYGSLSATKTVTVVDYLQAASTRRKAC